MRVSIKKLRKIQKVNFYLKLVQTVDDVNINAIGQSLKYFIEMLTFGDFLK
jgi:hypothetical protein